jgi:hypothetical protein
MSRFNFDNKRFALIQNSANGEVNAETMFLFKQDKNLVTADYFGGTIRYGKIIAELNGGQLNMLYQCLTTDHQLRAGKGIAEISLTDAGRIKLTVNWEWLTNANEKGKSEYLETE